MPGIENPRQNKTSVLRTRYFIVELCVRRTLALSCRGFSIPGNKQEKPISQQALKIPGKTRGLLAPTRASGAKGEARKTMNRSARIKIAWSIIALGMMGVTACSKPAQEATAVPVAPSTTSSTSESGSHAAPMKNPSPDDIVKQHIQNAPGSGSGGK